MAEKQLIGVVGTGTMGAGIAHTAAAHGYNVVSVDTNPQLVQRAYAALREQLDKRVASGKLGRQQRDDILQRLTVGETLDSLRDADFVIEAISEDLPAKRKLLAALEGACSSRTVLASNTSSLSISDMAKPLRHPERFVGMHFFNPAHVMPLVEVIAGEKTGPQAIVDTVALARSMNKTPVKAKDRPGFIANRVARPFYLESLYLLECGYADIPTIDAAIRANGFPMGPFELLDLIGLDVNLAVTKSVYEGFGKPARFAPNVIQERLVKDGRLGRKSGCGFYEHGGECKPVLDVKIGGIPGHPTEHPHFKAFADAIGKPHDAATWLFARVLTAVINEGAVTVGEETALARDVDLAMTLGLRYPDGPMALADHVGLEVVLNVLKTFHPDSPSGRHDPAPLIAELVGRGELGERTAAGLLRHSL